MFHIVSITTEGLSIIGPFDSVEKATRHGVLFLSDPRWNVVQMGEPAAYGMAEDQDFNTPHFCVQVTSP